MNNKKMTVTKENRFLTFTIIETGKYIKFCLRDKKFYNMKDKEIKLSNAKSFFAKIELEELGHDTTVARVILLVKFFNGVSTTIKNIATFIEKYMDYEFLESWINEPSVFLYMFALKSEGMFELKRTSSKASFENVHEAIQYNKLTKDTRQLINGFSDKVFEGKKFDINKFYEGIHYFLCNGVSIRKYYWGTEGSGNSFINTSVIDSGKMKEVFESYVYESNSSLMKENFHNCSKILTYDFSNNEQIKRLYDVFNANDSTMYFTDLIRMFIINNGIHVSKTYMPPILRKHFEFYYKYQTKEEQRKNLSILDISTKSLNAIFKRVILYNSEIINMDTNLRKKIINDFNASQNLNGLNSIFARCYDFDLSVYRIRNIMSDFDKLIGIYSHESQRTVSYIEEIIDYGKNIQIEKYEKFADSIGKDVNIIEEFSRNSYFGYDFYRNVFSVVEVISSMLSEYIDYMEMRRKIYNMVSAKEEGKRLTDNELNRLLKSSRYIKPENIKEEHDKAVKVFNNLKIEHNEEMFNLMKNPELNDTIGDYIIRVPNSANELAIEGAVLGNCVKSYIDHVVNGTTQICLLRHKDNLDTPNVVFEVRNGNLCQLEGKSRRRANQEESNVLHKYIKRKDIKCSVVLLPYKEKEKKIEA